MSSRFSYEFINHFNNMPLYCSVVGVSDFSLHWHQDIEMLFVLDGELCVNLNEDRLILKKGDILLINSNKTHFFEDTGKDNLVLLIQFSPAVMDKIDGTNARKHFRCNSTLPDAMQDESFSRLRTLLAHIGYEIYMERNGYEYFIISRFYEMIGILHRNFTYEIEAEDQVSLEDKNLGRIKEIVSYIEENYVNDITLGDLADAVHMSESYLSHFIKENIGIPFKRYLDTVRFHKSAEMLRTTDLAVIDIAVSCGFNNKQPMYRLYQKSIGMTPSEYRSRHKTLKYKGVSVINNYTVVNPTEAIKYFYEYMKE